MRITTGIYKGKVIKMPKGIRPTQNKVRKAVFDILGDIHGLSFLELFAGSGAIGFEAASRGAADLSLVENNRECLQAIKESIVLLKLGNCGLYPLEAERAVRRFYENKRKFDIIFLDPPYHKRKSSRLPASRIENGSGSMRDSERQSLSKKTLQILGAYDILAPDGFIIAQHFKKDNLPEQLGDLRLLRRKSYGDTLLSFYKKGCQ